MEVGLGKCRLPKPQLRRHLLPPSETRFRGEAVSSYKLVCVCVCVARPLVLSMALPLSVILPLAASRSCISDSAGSLLFLLSHSTGSIMPPLMLRRVAPSAPSRHHTVPTWLRE